MIKQMDRSLAEITIRHRLTQAQDLTGEWLGRVRVNSENERTMSEELGKLADIARGVGNASKSNQDIQNTLERLRLAVAPGDKEGLKFVLELEARFKKVDAAIRAVNELFEGVKSKE